MGYYVCYLTDRWSAFNWYSNDMRMNWHFTLFYTGNGGNDHSTIVTQRVRMWSKYNQLKTKWSIPGVAGQTQTPVSAPPGSSPETTLDNEACRLFLNEFQWLDEDERVPGHWYQQWPPYTSHSVIFTVSWVMPCCPASTTPSPVE